MIKKIMISCLLSRADQTYNMIDAYLFFVFEETKMEYIFTETEGPP